MSRSERLLDLIHTLRRHRRPVSGQALAAGLGVSIRTLYRDIATLQGQGNAVNIDAKLVERSRRAISGESLQLGAKTRIDWVQMQLVKESIDDVAAAIRGEVGSDFTHVTSKDGSKIWFAGPGAAGTLTLTPSQTFGGVKSAIKLMGYRQYVTETPDQVRKILMAAHGTVLL